MRCATLVLLAACAKSAPVPPAFAVTDGAVIVRMGDLSTCSRGYNSSLTMFVERDSGEKTAHVLMDGSELSLLPNSASRLVAGAVVDRATAIGLSAAHGFDTHTREEWVELRRGLTRSFAVSTSTVPCLSVTVEPQP